MEDSPNMRKYLLYLAIFSVVGISLVVLVILNNDKSENDLLYAIDSIGVNLAISVIASILIMIFFTNRDRRARHLRERIAAQKIASLIKKTLQNSDHLSPSELLKTYQRIEYLRDNFHYELDKQLVTQIDDILLEQTPSLSSLHAILAAIEQKYGATLFRPAKQSAQHGG